MRYPHYQEIPYQNPLTVFHYFSALEGSVFLDSARLMEGCARYSFIGVDPFYILQSKNAIAENPFNKLEELLKLFPLQFHQDMPPFQGGVMGYLSYDLCHYLENIPHAEDDMQLPDLILGFYDLVIAFDHELKRAWIFSSGYPELTGREARAKSRCAWLEEQLKQITAMPALINTVCDEKNIQSNFSSEKYQQAVKKVINYILDGDIFEANISQRFKTQLPDGLSAFELYRRLRLINAATFSAYLNFGDTKIVSASPERFLRSVNQQVETRPIKGTRPRGKDKEEDLQFANELMQSEKDHAENVMIVDLLRNDLSRVCEDDSVQVPVLCGLESYATVHHLVSVVTGQLKNNYNVVDLLRAAFPGGSITGAPKIRSMEIIAEIEPTKRGPYCGSVAYIGFNGDLDSSITIRTYAIQKNIVTFQAGGAITLDSDPETEYLETLTKARALRRALTECLVGDES